MTYRFYRVVRSIDQPVTLPDGAVGITARRFYGGSEEHAETYEVCCLVPTDAWGLAPNSSSSAPFRS